MPLGVETRRARWVAGSKPRREADCDNAERDEEQIPVHDNLLADSCNYSQGNHEKDMVPKRLIDISLLAQSTPWSVSGRADDYRHIPSFREMVALSSVLRLGR
jgi:hypothetical protein